METTPRRGRKLPLKGTAKHQRELEGNLTSLTAPSARRSDRSGAQIRSTHGRCRAGHPFTQPQNFRRSGIGIFQYRSWLKHYHGAGGEPVTLGNWETRENRDIQKQLAARQSAPGCYEYADVARRWGWNVRFFPVAALRCAPRLLQNCGLVHSILLRKASSITDGPKQQHDGGENSHSAQ
jgi:hypothetical protein